MANVTLRCADERLNEIVGKKFGENVTLAELGGIKWYLSRDGLEELFEQLEFAIEHKGAKSLALISHTDCGLYKELGEDDTDRYLEDLREAMMAIGEHFPQVKVSGYVYDVETKELNRVESEE